MDGDPMRSLGALLLAGGAGVLATLLVAPDRRPRRRLAQALGALAALLLGGALMLAGPSALAAAGAWLP
jgi:hypothetical protein